MENQTKKTLTMDELVNTVKNVSMETVTSVLDEQNEKLAKGIDEKLEKLAGEFESKIQVGKEEMEKDTKAGFKSFSHFCKDIATVERTSGRVVSKELEKWEDFCTKAAGNPSQNITDHEAGGALIPEEFRNQLLNAVEETNDLMNRTTRVPMSSNSVKIPFVNGFDHSGGLVYGNVQWIWADEEEQYSEKSVKFGNISMNLKKVTGLAFVSDEMLEDSPISMEGILTQAFREGLNYQMNNVIIRGSGAGQPLGLLNAPCKIEIAKESGQAASTILFENIIKMYSRISNPSSAVFIANPDTLPQLATMSIAVGTGGIPVYMPANGAAGRPYSTLMGLPLIFNRHCSTVGSVGDIMLVDMSQYLLGTKAGREGSRFDTSIHLKFDYGQTAYRFTMRIDGQVWWKSAFTPPQSSDTISPIVTIAARS